MLVARRRCRLRGGNARHRLLDMNYQRDSTSGIEGLELIECLRKMESTLPIIALTGWGNVQLAVRAMQAGADDFIEKPWRNDTLLEKVIVDAAGAGARSSQRVSEFERRMRRSCRRALCRRGI